ncbi:MarR family transcriptional regulator [Allosaccharopolyspora coralli]|uniref:MarR family transcriptional regulator n=1 Tax=Allosaccharopolyspora coralli TaxID=2665642 RepID=A0A5Q3QEG2_9PSEU|nr:MarR family transcriptional regulator [Allosaccharopolyspora coralli]QGK69187.1 MarR family transcriptional regulator [Allosaccharopolyspora coralli]
MSQAQDGGSDRDDADRVDPVFEDTPRGALPVVERALGRTAERLPDVDRAAMTMVLLLHRVANTVVYDLESTVHRPAGWSWSAFRLVFTLWASGPQESSRAAELTGMSRAAVSSLSKTLSASGLVRSTPADRDRRAVVLSLTDEGTERLESTFQAHNAREAEWAGLLTADEVATLNVLLTKLASAAQTANWVSHRS